MFLANFLEIHNCNQSFINAFLLSPPPPPPTSCEKPLTGSAFFFMRASEREITPSNIVEEVIFQFHNAEKGDFLETARIILQDVYLPALQSNQVLISRTLFLNQVYIELESRVCGFTPSRFRSAVTLRAFRSF